MNNIRNDWFKAYVVDVLPCLTIAIYILAIIYNVAYFSVFNINITHYLSLSEMLLSIIDILVIVSLFSLIIVWFLICYITEYVPYEKRLDEEEDAKRREKKTYKQEKLARGKHLSFKIRRLLVNIKRSIIVTFILKVYRHVAKVFGRIKERMERKTEERKQREAKLNEDGNYHSWSNFSLAFFCALGSFAIYYFAQERHFIKVDLMSATFALILPIMIYMIFIANHIISKYYPSILNKCYYFVTIPQKASDFAEIFLVYYIYALAIFYMSGIENGNYNKFHDIAEFEIKLSDGHVLDDSTYRYIEQANNKVFLYEKETKKNVILSSEAILYMKIYNKDNNNNSIITRITKEMFYGNKTNNRKN